MTSDDALQFLSRYQPLPSTSAISEDLLTQFDEVRTFFALHTDNRCIPLLLNSFGEGDGHGVYQLVEDTILQYPKQIVIPSLLDGLQSQHSSVRTWCAEIAANFDEARLVVPLSKLLDAESIDERLAAIVALGVIGDSHARAALIDALENEREPEVRDAITSALNG